MNLRVLDYIVAVAEQGHFGRAAAQCHVTQPTLSGQIKKLEDELGVTLFERGTRGVTLTAVGRDIISVARDARQAVARLKTVALAAQDPLAGTVSLGLIPTVAPYLIPRFVGRISEVLPDLSVQYYEDETERLIARLYSGELDMAVLATPPESERLSAIDLYEEPFWIVFPDHHPLAQLESIAMSDVRRDEVLLLTEGHCFRDQALSLCGERPEGQQNLRATSLETLINLVASVQGITLVPELAMTPARRVELGLSAQRLKERGARRRLYLTYRREFPRVAAAQALAKLICAGVPEDFLLKTA